MHEHDNSQLIADQPTPTDPAADPRKDAVEDGGTRPGKSSCECHSTKHDRDPLGVCPREGTMHDGWFICGPCVRHAPQLDRAVR